MSNNLKLCFKSFFITLAITHGLTNATAQDIKNQVPYFTFGKGLGITSPDSLFQMNIRFRMQNRIGMVTNTATDWRPEVIEARIRRLRLRLDGYVYSPKLTYVLQLAFSRGDMDYEDTGFPNIIRDAMVIYNFDQHFALGIGQTKLPGNRQRVTSSGDLQFPDRSIVNQHFNIDRDFGVQAYYRNKIGGFNYVLRGAISSGDGRNFNEAHDGLAYTGRIELLPFGVFTNNGDYFEGDLMREQHPKVSIAGGFSNNEDAMRSGGQLGKFLYAPRDIETAFFDFLFKYNGWAFAAEYIDRNAHNPITYNPDDPTEEQHVFVGYGQNYQGSYLFRKNFEIGLRYSKVTPDETLQTDLDIDKRTPERTQYTLGLTQYLKGHRVKLQTEFTLEEDTWPMPENPDKEFFIFRFQIEVGI
jgi:phosphate-selective porin OprO/OprP